MIVVDNNGAFVTHHTGEFAKSCLLEHPEEPAVDYVIMHPVQLLAVINFFPIAEIETVERKMGPDEKMPDIANLTFMGIPLVQDQMFSEDVIEMRAKDHTPILRIKNLAVPQDAAHGR